MREWVNLKSPLANFDLVVQLGDAQTDYVAVGGDSVAAWASSEQRDGMSTVDHLAGLATPAIESWFCLELVFTFPPPGTGEVEVFVDGTSVLVAAAITPAPMFDRALVGGVRLDHLGFHVVVDDVVIADQRIGCQ